MSAQSTPGPLASRQGTEQETYAGPWIVSHEGSPVIKRELRFVEDGAPAGWELLSGDTSQLEALIARAPDLVAENEQLKAKLEIANEALYRTATRIRDLRDDLPLKDDKRSHELLVSIGIEIRENLKALTTHPARGEDGAVV